MRNVLFLSLLVIVFALGFSQHSKADCFNDGGIIRCIPPVQNNPVGPAPLPPPNTSNGNDTIVVEENGGVEVVGERAIDARNGNNTVTTSGIISSTGMSNHALTTGNDADDVRVMDGEISAVEANGVNTGRGADAFTMTGGTISSEDAAAVQTSRGNDNLAFIDGTVIGGSNGRAVNSQRGSDILMFFGGTFTGDILSDRPANNNNGAGFDSVTVFGGTFNDTDFFLGRRSDTINVVGDVEIDLINCGLATDTLIFSQSVPNDQVQPLTDMLAMQGADGSITINTIEYEWESCEMLVANFNGLVNIITLGPFVSTDGVPGTHTVTATIQSVDAGDAVIAAQTRAPLPGIVVLFEIVEGPNTGLTSEADGSCSNPACTTDSNGQVDWTYESIRSGVDVITASFIDPDTGVLMRSNSVEEVWTITRNVPTLSEWGLIAMAGLLGIVGFMVIRRRAASAGV